MVKGCGEAVQIFQKHRSHLKILDARRVTWSKFYIEVAQISGATATLRPGFVHPWLREYGLLKARSNFVDFTWAWDREK